MTSRSASRRVLIVEDDAGIRAMMRLILEDEGYTISEAADGDEAVAAIRRRPFDAVLLDLMMPKLDGFGVLEQIRSMPSRALMPVVVVTARHDPAGVVSTIESGAVDHLAKPFSADELVRTLSRAISGDGTDERRENLMRTARAYEAAESLQGIAAAADVAVERNRFRRAR